MSKTTEAGSDRSRWQCAEPQWELFQDNESIWQAVFEQCDAANFSIDLEQHIFGTEGVGRQLLDLLAAKAREGVAVGGSGARCVMAACLLVFGIKRAILRRAAHP